MVIEAGRRSRAAHALTTVASNGGQRSEAMEGGGISGGISGGMGKRNRTLHAARLHGHGAPLLASTSSSSFTAASGTSPSRVNRHSAEPWCLRAGDSSFAAAVVANTGWAVQTGGAGGSKRWLQARSIGAFLQLRLRMTSPRLALEYYKHDSLPLGTVQATLIWGGGGGATSWPINASHPSSITTTASLGAVVLLLDGRCAEEDHCPKGQGFYHRALLADGLVASVAAPVTGTLRLVVVPREDGSNGTDFSLVTVVSEV